MRLPAFPSSLLAAVLLAAALPATGCKAERLRKLESLPREAVVPEVRKLTVDACASRPERLRMDLRITFVLDVSRSNEHSDPLSSRFDRIEAFLNDAVTDVTQTGAPDETLYFSLITFSSDAREERVYESTGSADPFGRRAGTVTERLSRFRSKLREVKGRGADALQWSDFSKALTAARAAVEKDLDLAVTTGRTGGANPSVYAVVFMSDGVPTILSSDGTEAKQEKNLILSAVSGNLMKAFGRTDPRNAFLDQIVLNTGYYGALTNTPEEDALAKDILRSMVQEANGLLSLPDAKPGNVLGEFVDFSGQDLELRRFAFPERQRKFELREVLVRNENLVWEQGRLLPDSDADGLSDELETAYALDPADPDTNHDGVGDGVTARIFGCAAGECLARDPTSFKINICRGLWSSEQPLRYPDSDADGLNDCEEALIGSSLASFHSANSWVPDSVLFFSGVNPLAPASEFLSDPDASGMTLYQRLKGFLPRMGSPKDPAHVPAKYRVSRRQEAGKAPCWNVEVDHLTYARTTDRFRVYWMESSPGFRKDLLRSAVKPMSGMEIRFTDSDLR